MRKLHVPAMVLAVLFAAPVLAQESAPGRYTMTPAGDGMLRLDTQTGEVSQCSNLAGNWACRSVPDDRIALENEIDRLNAENRRLRAQLAKPGDKSADKPDQTDRERGGSQWWLPDDREIAEFRSFLEKMMRELRALVESAKDANPEKKL